MLPPVDLKDNRPYLNVPKHVNQKKSVITFHHLYLWWRMIKTSCGTRIFNTAPKYACPSHPRLKLCIVSWKVPIACRHINTNLWTDIKASNLEYLQVNISCNRKRSSNFWKYIPTCKSILLTFIFTFLF